MDVFAFIFPGQGSQSVGMLADHAVRSEHSAGLIEQVFAEASDAIDFDLYTLMREGPQEKLDATEYTQPALLAGSFALWKLWLNEGGGVPGWLAGHSLGEYSALVCAGALSFSDAVRLVHHRGLFMKEAVPEGEGGMAAVIGLSDQQVIAACQHAAGGGVVEAVNFNAPGQVVIAGDIDAVGRAIARCREVGAKRVIPLAVSVPSHCALMKPAAQRLAVELAQVSIQPPEIPIVHNVTVGGCSEPDKIRENLVRQLYSPVRWVESVERLVDSGCTVFGECGPGRVLAGMGRRISRESTFCPMESVSDFERLLASGGK